jgi:hypothetical protein
VSVHFYQYIPFLSCHGILSRLCLHANLLMNKICLIILYRGCHDHDRMVIGFTTTCAISAYHRLSCEFEPRSWRGVLDTTSYGQVCQWLATGRWFSLGNLVSTTNKTNRHDITEILLKMALSTITQTLTLDYFVGWYNRSVPDWCYSGLHPQCHLSFALYNRIHRFQRSSVLYRPYPTDGQVILDVVLCIVV